MTEKLNTSALQKFIVGSLVIVGTSLSGLAYIPLSNPGFLDMLIIPAVFTAITTNKTYSFLIGMVWALSVLVINGATLNPLTVIASRTAATLVAHYVYRALGRRRVSESWLTRMLRATANIKAYAALLVASVVNIFLDALGKRLLAGTPTTLIEIFVTHFAPQLVAICIFSVFASAMACRLLDKPYVDLWSLEED